MRLHFQRNAQTERQRWRPYVEKLPKERIPEHILHQFCHVLQITIARLGTITSASVPLQIIHFKPKRNWKWLLMNFQDEGNNLPGAVWGQLRSHWFLWGATRSSQCPKRSQNRHTPNTDPIEPRGLIPQIFDIFSGKLTMWEGRKLLFTAQEDLPISNRSQGVFYLFNLQRRYWCGMSAASWQWQTELRPDYSTLDGTDTQFQWCYFDPAWHEPIIRIQKF